MDTTTATLTVTQRRGVRTRALVVLALALLTQKQGRPPTVRELCDYTGYHSTGSMGWHLNKLADAGLVRHVGGSRGYVLVKNWRDLYAGMLRELGDDAGKE